MAQEWSFTKNKSKKSCQEKSAVHREHPLTEPFLNEQDVICLSPDESGRQYSLADFITNMF